MKTKQIGFTLIELVMVILILSILAVTAIPKFFDLSTEARRGALAGVAGGVASGSSINFAARSLNAANGIAVTDCSQAGSLLQEGVCQVVIRLQLRQSMPAQQLTALFKRLSHLS